MQDLNQGGKEEVAVDICESVCDVCPFDGNACFGGCTITEGCELLSHKAEAVDRSESGYVERLALADIRSSRRLSRYMINTVTV